MNEESLLKVNTGSPLSVTRRFEIFTELSEKSTHFKNFPNMFLTKQYVTWDDDFQVLGMQNRLLELYVPERKINTITAFANLSY